MPLVLGLVWIPDCRTPCHENLAGANDLIPSNLSVDERRLRQIKMSSVDRLSVGIVILVFALAACGQSTGSTAPTPTPSSSAPQPLRMVVLGDSIATGTSYGGLQENGWPAIVAHTLGLSLINRAEAGTGYATAFLSRKPYTARVDEIVGLKPDIVIVEGSRNDEDAAATKLAAAEVLGKLRSGLPQAGILVIGPIYSFTTNVGTTPVNDAVKAAAAGLRLTYVDTVKAGWFTGSAHRLIAADGVHPTDEGHRYLADLITPRVKLILPSGYSIPTPS
jgi:lysophospholipase L1-like esterase